MASSLKCITRKQWTIFTLGVLIVSLAAVIIWFLMPPREPIGLADGELPKTIEGGQKPVAGSFIGHSKSKITERFGPPSHQSKGHYGNPPAEYRRKYAEAVTFFYDTPTGTLYLSFCLEEGDWVCFSSHWLPKGVVF
jgi:hypothetical protein